MSQGTRERADIIYDFI